MTLTQDTAADADPVPEGHVRLTIDGRLIDAPKGELLIRACERLGIIVPRFCDHPLLEPAGACRQCLVEVEMGRFFNWFSRTMPEDAALISVSSGLVECTSTTSSSSGRFSSAMETTGRER